MIPLQKLLRPISKQLPKLSNLTLPNPLTPHYVQSTLKSYPTDLDKLKLFLHFARQPNYFHTPQSFDYMVPSVSRLTYTLQSVHGVVQELKNQGCLIRGQTFLLLLRIYSRGDMYDMALETFYVMEKCGFMPDTFVRNIVIDVLFKSGDVYKGLEFFKETRNPNFLTYNTLLCHLYKLNCAFGVCDVLRVMVREGFRPNFGSFFMALDSLCKEGRMVEGLRVFGLMIVSGIGLTVQVWSILIDGFCRAGEFGMASELLEKMIGAGHSPNIVTYTFLIKGFLNDGMFDRVRGILMTMESKGCLPDLFLYNILMDGTRKFEGHKTTRFVFPERELQSDSNTLSSYFIKSGFLIPVVDIYNHMLIRGLDPDVYSYAGLLSSLCREGEFTYAINIYKGILRENIYIDACVSTVMINELIEVGMFKTAIMLFKKAVAKNVPLDVVSYNVTIKALVRDDRFEDAHDLYGQMKARGVLPNIYTCNYMLKGYCKGRDFRLIQWFVTEMVDSGIKPNYVTFKIIIRFMNRSRRVCSACKVHNVRRNCNECEFVLRRVHEAFSPLLKFGSEDMLFVDETDSDDISDIAAPFA